MGWSCRPHHALSDSSPYPFGILDICDVDHLHAAIAPRPLMVRANLPDHWWPVSGLGAIEKLSRQVVPAIRRRRIAWTCALKSTNTT